MSQTSGTYIRNHIQRNTDNRIDYWKSDFFHKIQDKNLHCYNRNKNRVLHPTDEGMRNLVRNLGEKGTFH